MKIYLLFYWYNICYDNKNIFDIRIREIDKLIYIIDICINDFNKINRNK